MPEGFRRYWCDLEEESPIDISQIVSNGEHFDIYINKNDLESLLDARKYLDNILIGLMQILYDDKFLKKKEDQILFWILKEDTGRMMKNLDLLEESLKSETKESIKIPKLIYKKNLSIILNAVIFDSLKKASDEYNAINEKKETEETESEESKIELIKKEPRTFFYIFFQIFSKSMSLAGGLTREKTGVMKKSMGSFISPNWQNLMGEGGQKQIGDEVKDKTGKNLKDVTEEDYLGILGEDYNEDEEDDEEGGVIEHQ